MMKHKLCQNKSLNILDLPTQVNPKPIMKKVKIEEDKQEVFIEPKASVEKPRQSLTDIIDAPTQIMNKKLLEKEVRKVGFLVPEDKFLSSNTKDDKIANLAPFTATNAPTQLVVPLDLPKKKLINPSPINEEDFEGPTQLIGADKNLEKKEIRQEKKEESKSYKSDDELLDMLMNSRIDDRNDNKEKELQDSLHLLSSLEEKEPKLKVEEPKIEKIQPQEETKENKSKIKEQSEQSDSQDTVELNNKDVKQKYIRPKGKQKVKEDEEMNNDQKGKRILPFYYNNNPPIKEKTKPDRKESKKPINRKRKYNEIESDEESEEEYKSSSSDESEEEYQYSESEKEKKPRRGRRKLPVRKTKRAKRKEDSKNNRIIKKKK